MLILFPHRAFVPDLVAGGMMAARQRDLPTASAAPATGSAGHSSLSGAFLFGQQAAEQIAGHRHPASVA